MMRKISAFVLAFVLALTAGLVIACSEVEVPPRPEYTVTYYYNYTGSPDNGIYRADKYEPGAVAQKPTSPTREGYTWLDWTVNAAAGSSSYNFSTTLTGNIDLYAQWRKNESDEHGVLTDITVTAPTKTYKVGDAFDKSDVTVTAKYTDGSTRTITAFDCTAPDMSTAGKKELTVTYKNISKKISITVNEAQAEKKLTDIKVTAPTETYKVGDVFNKSDITVKAVYSDDSEVDVTDFECSTPDMSTAGEKEITVSYEGIDKTIKITVESSEVTPDSIEITEPTKKVYTVGEEFDAAGLTVKAVYSDGSKKDVALSDCKVTGYDKTKSGEQTITVTYEGKSKTFTVTVNAVLNEIKVTTQPTKKVYGIGDTLDRKGMVVTAYYADDTEKVITDYTVEFDSSKAGENVTVTVKYKGKSDSFTVTVNAAELVAIELTSAPEKDSYEVGDDFDETGMVITAIYSDSSREVITSGYTVHGFDSSKAGTCTITVTYKGKTTTSFTVEVEQITYDVAFVTGLDNPAAPEKQTVNKNGHATEPTKADYARNGYNFLGWFDGENEFKFATTAVTRDLCLYAKWEAIEYNITYELAGSVTFDGDEESTAVVGVLSGNQKTKYTIETESFNLEIPTVDVAGATFYRWHKNSADGEVVSRIAKGTTGHIKLYAEYTAKATVKFNFDYNYTGSGDPEEQSVVSGLTASRIENPTRTGYTFVNWYNTEECADGDTYDFTAAVTAETTVYAKWTAKTITVTFKPENGVTASYTASVAYDATIPAQEQPTRKTGHTFAGWYRINGGAEWDFAKTLEEVLLTEGKDDALTLEAHWTAQAYNVVFKNGDTTVATESITFGSTIPTEKKPADPTKLGHKFEGWYDGDNKWTFGTGSSADKLATEGLELTAKWSAKSYNVKYICGDDDETQVVEFGKPVPAPTTLSTAKTGYQFDGWYYDNNGTQTKWTFGDNLQTEGLELTAKWNAKDIDVEFIVDGVVASSTTAKYDGKVTKPANPQKTGYTFLHWHILDTHTVWYFDGDTDENGVALTPSTVQQESKLKLEAHWEANTYTITYHMGDYANALTAEAYTKYTYGTEFTLPSANYVKGLITEAGYSFLGWYDNADWSGERYTVIAANAAAGDKVFYAKITQNSTVVFTYNLQYGDPKNYPTENVVIGTKKDNSYTPSRTHYTFMGWYNTADCDDGDTYNFNNTVTEATIVYAKWEAIEYTVTFYTQDGNEPTVVKYTNAQTIKAIAEPTREGYDFKHWYVSNENTAYTFGGNPTADVNLYAKWDLHEYTVTFDLRYTDAEGNYVTTTKKVKYTQTFTAITAPTRDDGYTFAGEWYKESTYQNVWNFATDTMPAGNLTLYAKWNRNYYTVTFMSDSAEVTALKQTNVEHGTTILKPTTDLPTKVGHHLKTDAEWTLNNGTVWNFGNDTVTRNITLKANWEINTYTVAFNSNGGTAVASQNVNHGEKATEPTAPTKAGFTFGGWTLDGNPYNFNAEVVGSIILIASWEGDTGTYLYYSNNGADNWLYGYKAEKNGTENELVISRVTVYNGMEFRIVTKNENGANTVLTAGMSSSLTEKGIFTIAKNGDNFKLTFNNANYSGSVWTFYVYNISSGVTVGADGALSKSGTASGISMVQQHDTTKFTPDNTALTSAPLTTPAADTIYIRGSFTDGFGLYKEWSNAADGGMLVLKSGNTYTFRHVYLAKTYGFKVYLSSMGDNGWFGGIYAGVDSVITLDNDNAPDVYLGSQFADGWYDIVFTDGVTKTLNIVAYAAPTVATVIVTPPTKTTYYVDQPFDATGMAVSYTDTDGKTYPLTTGYTVSGNETNVATESKTVTVTYQGKSATFTIKVIELVVTFDSNGGTAVAAQSISYNGKAVEPANANKPTLVGHDLVCWKLNGEVYDFNTKVTAPITLTAEWKLHEYTVTFKVEGKDDVTILVPYDTLIAAGKIPDTNRYGYTFTDWKDGNTVFKPATQKVTKDLELVAYYNRISYTVKFDYNNVLPTETETVFHGEKVDARAAVNTTRKGYDFKGWYYKNASNQDVLFDFDTLIEQAYELTARWDAVEYEITYNLDGTVVIDGTTTDVASTLSETAKTIYTIEDAFTLPIPTVITGGASFLKWQITVDGETKDIEGIEKGTTGDITLQAVYTTNALVSFTFNYNYEGAPANVVRQVTSGTTTTELSANRTGYDFDYWYYKNESNQEVEFDFDTPITKATVVYAHWTVHNRTVTFIANDGYWTVDDAQVTEKTQPTDFGSKILKPANPTREGYEFKGWTYNSAAWDFENGTMPDQNITMYAKWEQIKYTVTFMDGETELTALKKTNINHGSTIAAPTTGLPTKAGYTLKGWKNGETAWVFGEGGSAVTDNITLTADWEIIVYTISYYVDSTTTSSNAAENVITYKITDGTDGEVTLKNPTKTGHTFNGWYLQSDYSGEKVTKLTYAVCAGANTDKAVKLYGKFDINKYTVTFKAGEGYWTVDGEQVNEITREVEYNKAVTRPDDPTREGYAVKGWKKSDNTSYSFSTAVTTDITLTADWELAAKVDGLYNGNTLVKEFVDSDPQNPDKSYSAHKFKVETAPLRLKMYVDNEVPTAFTNIKSGSDSNVTYDTTKNEVVFGKQGIYTLHYRYVEYNGDKTGIYVVRFCDVEDYLEPNVDEEVDGVYIDGVRVKPFTVYTGNCNQVEAVSVQITAANSTTAKEVTFKYAGETVTLKKIDLQDGITNIGINNTVKLYSGTYDFYYNYGKNADGKAGRLWIQGTQTGGIKLTTTSYVAGSFNGWSSNSADYKFDSNGVMELDINTGDSFKIVKGGAWLGYDQLSIVDNAALYEDDTANNHNIKIKDGGTFQLIFDGSKLTITKIVVEAPNIAVGKYIVLDKLPIELTAADKFTAVSSTCYKIEFEISEATVVKIWNQTSTTTGNYEVVSEVHLNGGAKIEPVDTTMQAGKYRLEYNVYDNGAWVRLDFTKEIAIETTNELKGTKFVLTGSDTSITIYLANADGTGATLSQYKIWVWDTPSGNLYGTTDSDGGWSKRPTVTAEMTTTKALGDKISFKFTKDSSESNNFEGVETGKTYVVTIGANLQLTIQQYVGA